RCPACMRGGRARSFGGPATSSPPPSRRMIHDTTPGALADGPALLALMQLSDTALPIGRHAHALGLERLLRDGRVPDDRRLRQVVVSALMQGAARCDG